MNLYANILTHEDIFKKFEVHLLGNNIEARGDWLANEELIDDEAVKIYAMVACGKSYVHSA